MKVVRYAAAFVIILLSGEERRQPMFLKDPAVVFQFLRDRQRLFILYHHRFF